MGETKKPASTAAPKPEAKVEHTNIFAALSAFQAEAPKIEKTKRFGKEGEAMSFMYASLDDVLEKALPIAAKNGLSVVFEGDGDNLVCALYHTSYEKKSIGEKSTTRVFEGTTETVTEPVFEETGVLRSLPIKVARAGKMQEIGNNSTYARRYMICEMLGLAPDEDKDAHIEKESGKNAAAFAFTKAKEGINRAKTVADLEKAMKMIDDDVKKLEGGRAPALGLKMEQYEELRELGAVKHKELLDESEQQ